RVTRRHYADVVVWVVFSFFFQAEDGIRDFHVTGVQTCALPISGAPYFAALAGSEPATGVVRLLTAVILVEAVTAVRSAVLMREFAQDRLAAANLAGFAVNATVAISLAAAGAGAYSFAWGQLGGAIVTGAVIVRLARMPWRFGFDRAIAARLLRFGLPSAL